MLKKYLLQFLAEKIMWVGEEQTIFYYDIILPFSTDVFLKDLQT